MNLLTSESARLTSTWGKPNAGVSIVRKSANPGIANAVALTGEAVVSDAYVKRMEQDYAAKVLNLPDDVDGATALVLQLDASEVFALFGALRQGHETNTYLSLPRFRIRFATKLKNSFQRLGIARPFDEDHAERPRGRRFIQAHQIERR